MNYLTHYNQLVETLLLDEVERTELKKMGQYYENHHSIPRLMGGNNSLVPWLNGVFSAEWKNFWKNAGIIYDWWVRENKPGWARLRTISSAKLSYDTGSLVCMVKWFKINGDPRLHEQWVI